MPSFILDQRKTDKKYTEKQKRQRGKGKTRKRMPRLHVRSVVIKNNSLRSENSVGHSTLVNKGQTTHVFQQNFSNILTAECGKTGLLAQN